MTRRSTSTTPTSSARIIAASFKAQSASSSRPAQTANDASTQSGAIAGVLSMVASESTRRAAPIIPISREPRPNSGRPGRTACPVSVLCSCCGKVREVTAATSTVLTFADGTTLAFLACDVCVPVIDAVDAEVGLSAVSLGILRDEMQELKGPDPSVAGRIVRRVQWRRNPGRILSAALEAVKP